MSVRNTLVVSSLRIRAVFYATSLGLTEADWTTTDSKLAQGGTVHILPDADKHYTAPARAGRVIDHRQV